VCQGNTNSAVSRYGVKRGGKKSKKEKREKKKREKREGESMQKKCLGAFSNPVRTPLFVGL
jgi:hypothetical protein